MDELYFEIHYVREAYYIIIRVKQYETCGGTYNPQHTMVWPAFHHGRSRRHGPFAQTILLLIITVSIFIER